MSSKYSFTKAPVNVQLLRRQLAALISEVSVLGITHDESTSMLLVEVMAEMSSSQIGFVQGVITMHNPGTRYRRSDERFFVETFGSQNQPVSHTWYAEKVGSSYTGKVREIVFNYSQGRLVDQTESTFDSNVNVLTVKTASYFIDRSSSNPKRITEV